MENLRTTLVKSVRRPMALSLAVAILNLSATVAFAAPATVAARGMLMTSGVVTVNGLLALSDQTIVSSDSIVTARGANSTLELGNFTRLLLSEQTELALDFSATSISGSLRRGEVRSFIPAARTLSIVTPDGVVATDSSQPAVFSVQVEPVGTRIYVETGRVELRSGSNRRVVAAGETFSSACDSFALSPAQHQNLTKGERIGIFAGIGAGIGLLLVAMTVGKHEEPVDFGGCAIILSPGAEPGC